MALRTAVGGLMLLEHEKWSFSVHYGIIVGLRDNDAGTMRIRHIERNMLPHRLEHEFCLEAARQLLAVPPGQVFDRDLIDTICGPYGAGTFAGPKEVHRVWYCNRPPGMIAGVYICPADAAREAMYRLVVRECSHLMATAIFDRISWGGDEPLTRALIESLERAERERDRG